MLVQRLPVVVAELVQQPRRALHVREQQRHDTGREIAHHRARSWSDAAPLSSEARTGRRCATRGERLDYERFSYTLFGCRCCRSRRAISPERVSVICDMDLPWRCLRRRWIQGTMATWASAPSAASPHPPRPCSALAAVTRSPSERSRVKSGSWPPSSSPTSSARRRLRTLRTPSGRARCSTASTTRWRRRSAAPAGRSRSSSATRSWPPSVRLLPRRTTRSARCTPPWRCAAARELFGDALASGSASTPATSLWGSRAWAARSSPATRSTSRRGSSRRRRRERSWSASAPSPRARRLRVRRAGDGRSKGKAGGVVCRRLLRALSLSGRAACGGLRRAFVGRESELERLREAYGVPSTSGEPHLVTIMGDAGVGKTTARP